MKDKARALTGAVLLLALAQALLLLWKAALGALLSPDAFGEKMITMSGMALLTAAAPLRQYHRLEGAGLRGWAAVWISAGLFSLWHIGYILGALWAGQWLSLTKLAVGLAYGLITGAVRHKTGGWMPSLLVHAALNTLLG